jgi:hypothetical protein
MSEISQKQLVANRENAKLGGVKTEEGKEISKYNAVKHGLLSSRVLIDGEDEEKFIGFAKKLRDELNPNGEMEEFLVDRVISGVWRLRRILEIEKNSMEWGKKKRELSLEDEEQIKREGYMRMIYENTDLLLRYENMLEKGIFKALEQLKRAR